jgi:hypothetical protein
MNLGSLQTGLLAVKWILQIRGSAGSPEHLELQYLDLSSTPIVTHSL